MGGGGGGGAGKGGVSDRPIVGVYGGVIAGKGRCAAV